jgi:hypothetical protein
MKLIILTNERLFYKTVMKDTMYKKYKYCILFLSFFVIFPLHVLAGQDEAYIGLKKLGNYLDCDLDAVHKKLASYEEKLTKHLSKGENGKERTTNIALGAITIIFKPEKEEDMSKNVTFYIGNIAERNYFDTLDGNEHVETELSIFDSDYNTNEYTKVYENEKSEGKCLFSFKNIPVVNEENGDRTILRFQDRDSAVIGVDKIDQYFTGNEGIWNDNTFNKTYHDKEKKFQKELIEFKKGAIGIKKNISETLSDIYKITKKIEELGNKFSSNETIEEVEKIRPFMFLKDITIANDLKNLTNYLAPVSKGKTVHKKVESLEKDFRDSISEYYGKFWHSEQRLAYYLLKSDMDTSNFFGLVKEQIPAEKIASIFLHVHSCRNFCERCRYTLARLTEHLRDDYIGKVFNEDDEHFNPNNFYLLGSFRDELIIKDENGKITQDKDAPVNNPKEEEDFQTFLKNKKEKFDKPCIFLGKVNLSKD